MDHEPAHIRRYQPDDLDDLRRISLLTAYNGQDATRLFDDPMLPGHIHVAPYVLVEPSLAFVSEDAAGAGGYVIAALDSQAFEQRLEPEWWPAQRTRYPEPSPDRAEETPLSQRYAL